MSCYIILSPFGYVKMQYTQEKMKDYSTNHKKLHLSSSCCKDKFVKDALITNDKNAVGMPACKTWFSKGIFTSLVFLMNWC